MDLTKLFIYSVSKEVATARAVNKARKYLDAAGESWIKALCDPAVDKSARQDATDAHQSALSHYNQCLLVHDRVKNESETLTKASQLVFDYTKRVRERAYYISLSDESGSAFDNWLKAEQEELEL